MMVGDIVRTGDNANNIVFYRCFGMTPGKESHLGLLIQFVKFNIVGYSPGR